MTPILTTKLTHPPLRHDFVPRARLIDRLNTGLTAKLTLLAAPAGFGKTTLVVEWLASLEKEKGNIGDKAPSSPSPLHCWLSLDSSDNDLTRFLTYLLAALQTVHPTLGEAAQALLQVPQIPPIEVLLTILINELNNPVLTSSHLILILDDYHEISDPSIQHALNFLLEHQPPAFHLVITSRADPPLPLPRLRARGQMTEIRAADLRFTPSETAAFLNHSMNLTLTAEDIAALETRTEGWIAGLQLAALALQNQPDPVSFINAFTGTHRFILDYLAEEILQRQPPEIQTFLLETALLDRLTPPLCDAVTGRPNSAATLHYLHETNLFITALDDRREWFRYHKLFRDVIEMRARSTFPDRLSDNHRRAAEWYAQAGFVEDALNHLIELDASRAAEIVEENAWLRFDQGDIYAVRNWVNRLPPELVHTRPLLILVQATILLATGQLPELDQLLSETADILNDPALPPVIQGELAQVRATQARFTRDIPLAITHAQEALTLLPEDRYGTRAGALVNLVLAYLDRGETDAVEASLADLITLGNKGFQFAVLGALQGAAWMQMQRGNLHQSVQRYHQVLEQARSVYPRPIVALGLALGGLGELFYEWNDLDEAVNSLNQAISYLRNSIEQIIFAFVAGSLAKIHIARSNFPAAHAVLDDAETWMADMHLSDLGFSTLIAGHRALIWLAQGNIPIAARWADASGLSSSGDFFYPRQREYPILARVYLAQNKPGAALAVLEPLHNILKGMQWNDQLLEVLCLQALAHQATGQKEKALDCLAQALEIASPEGYIRTFLDEGEPMETLLRMAQVREIGKDYPAKLLAKFATANTRPTSDTLPDPLSDRETEVLHLAADGLSNQQIAETLIIALPTVKKHISNILVKLDAANRTQAIARARDLSLL